MCPSVQCLHRNPPGLETSHSCFGSRTRSRPSTCRIGSAAAALHPCPSTETRHVAALPRWRRSRNCQLLECSAGGNTNRTAKGRAWRSWDLWPKWLPGEPDILSISIIFIQKMSRIECSNILRPKPKMFLWHILTHWKFIEAHFCTTALATALSGEPARLVAAVDSPPQKGAVVGPLGPSILVPLVNGYIMVIV